jgi:MFS family permease
MYEAVDGPVYLLKLREFFMTQDRGTVQLAPSGADFPVPADTAMTTGVATSLGSPARAATRGRISGGPALYLLASLVVSLLAGSAAPTPLYAIYQRQWGFSPITTTIVFGVYAVAVLAALLALGRLSDSVGRKPVLLAALGVQVLSMLVFASAGGVGELLAARVIQGLATGAALGAIGAGMLDVDRERGALANALSPGLGTGSGALISALFVQFLPGPTHLVYYALIGVFALQAVGVGLLRETVTRVPVTASVFVPEVRLPRAVRGPVLAAAPVLFAVWALAGLYAALGPALVQTLTGSASVVLGAASVTVLTVTAVSSVYLLRNVYARSVLVTGIAALVVGVAITLIALGAGSVGLFFAGTAVSGIGFGAGFQGGIRTVVPQAAPHERAGVLSLLFVISYLGMGVPAVAAGFGATDGLGLLGSARDYGIALIATAGLALVGLRRSR